MNSEKRTEADYEVLVRAIITLTGGKIIAPQPKELAHRGVIVRIARNIDLVYKPFTSWQKAHYWITKDKPVLTTDRHGIQFVDSVATLIDPLPNAPRR